MTKYNVIYSDPPWSFKTFSDKGKGRSAEAHYETMSLDDIKSIDIDSLASDNCVLFLWATDPLLRKAFEVIDAWGFEYKTVGFYWVKTNKDHAGWFMGTGYWSRANPEQCLLATRGKPTPQSHDVRRLIVSERREHSRKPDEIYPAIEALCQGPYVEMFARHPREGWTTAFSTLEGSAERRWASKSGPEDSRPFPPNDPRQIRLADLCVKHSIPINTEIPHELIIAAGFTEKDSIELKTLFHKLNHYTPPAKPLDLFSYI